MQQNPKGPKQAQTKVARPAPKSQINIRKIEEASVARAVDLRNLGLAPVGATYDPGYAPVDAGEADELPLPDEQVDLGANSRDSNTGQDRGVDRACSNMSRAERYHYMPMEEGAPTGVSALICPSDLKPAKSRGPRVGTWEPPGYVSARDRERLWIFNRSHILGDRFNGAWIRENIFTGFREMNDPGMKKCENRMAGALATEAVAYFGVLEYDNGRGNIPTAIRMTAATRQGILFDVTVDNRPGSQVTC